MRQSTKKAPAEAAAHATPKVFSCGQLAKWVSFICSVTGCEIEFAARYTHAAKAYSRTARSTAIIAATARPAQLSAQALATGIVLGTLHRART
jgi:hypothetical protein